MSTTVNGANADALRPRSARIRRQARHQLLEGRPRRLHRDGRPAGQHLHARDDAPARRRDLDARFDPDVEVIVLTGKGEKFFSAGANIGMLNQVTPEFKYMFCLHANETLSRLEQTPKLVIAALNGHCVGGGLEIAMAADMRIARKDAGKIGLPEVALGVLPGTGGTQRLARLVGKSRAIEMMATGKTVSFEQALDWGMINDLYEGSARRVPRADHRLRQAVLLAEQGADGRRPHQAQRTDRRRASVPRRARARTRAAIAALQERGRERRPRRLQRKARRPLQKQITDHRSP